MLKLSSCAGIVVLLSLSLLARAETTVDDLRSEVESLRKSMSDKHTERDVSRAIESKFSGQINAPVQTKAGRLKIGGLLQVWAYTIQNDNTGVVDLDQIAIDADATAPTNEIKDNDSFRIRRAELSFTLDITENITSVITVDFARENTFPFLPTNQANSDGGAAFLDSCGCEGELSDPRGLAAGAGTANRITKEAYIHYHDFVPHHDFKVGLFSRHLGEEGSRDDSQLDFAERAMISQLSYVRDLGLQVHGSWWDNRLEYWLGVFDGAGTAYQERGNRSDDNDEKDLAGTLRVFPVRNNETWGTLEVGYSLMNGVGGESAGHLPGTNPVNGLNRRVTTHSLEYIWLGYAPGGAVKGWWMRGEWGQYRDRFAPSEASSGLDVVSTDPAPFNIQGWNVSTGYRFDRMPCHEKLLRALRYMEFTFRYDVMQNFFFHDLVAPTRRFDVFKTQVYTAGINYQISENAKLQLNYNWVLEEDHVDKDDRQLREVRNNNLVLNLQVSF